MAGAVDVRVRLATARDAEAIFNFLIPMAHEWAIFPPNRAKAARALYDFFEAEENFALVALIGDEIVASCGFALQDGWFFDDLFFGEMWFYVGPAGRNTAAGKTVEKKCREFSDRSGLPMMMLVMHLERTDLKNEFFRRRGWAHMGGVFGYGFKRG